LSLRLKECKLSTWRTAAGKLFHTTGPATEKALSPISSIGYWATW